MPEALDIEELAKLRAAAEEVRDWGNPSGWERLAAALIVDYMDAGHPTKARRLAEKLAEHGHGEGGS